MSDVIITVENLSKKYLVGHQTGGGGNYRYTALRDIVGREVRNLARKTIDIVRGRQIVQGDDVEEFWALKDVSFEVQRGGVLGIIGRNGAGKSTLLKILSRITEPTQGRVTLRGRVASLLEVGTGFHPELTGRENIYLNGAILGMTRAEIKRKFDEIVAFAEVEKFLDTPVKRYSSGMYVRLAFAVAAHLEPEILIVDEVLAVGDAEFQKKCLGRMSEVAGAGRTVLFVSHNMGAISRLCTRALLLVDGKVHVSGMPTDVIECYVSRNEITTTFLRPPTKSSRPMVVGVSCIQPEDAGTPQSAIDIELTISSQEATSVSIDVRLKDDHSSPVGFGSVGQATRPVSIKTGMNSVIVTISTKYLAVGEYLLSIDLTNPFIEFYDRVEDCLRFSVSPNLIPDAGHFPDAGHYFEQRWGYGSTLIPLSLKIVPESEPGNTSEHSVESATIGQ